MDLCRGTQEVEAVLVVEDKVSCDPLGRLRLAMQYNEKKASILPLISKLYRIVELSLSEVHVMFCECYFIYLFF